MPVLMIATYLGCVSGNKTPDKVAKSGLHVTRSSHVDAPTIDELPLVFECELVSMDPDTCLVVGKVVNVACDESVLTDGKPDAETIAPYDMRRGRKPELEKSPLHWYDALCGEIESALKEDLNRF